MSQYIIISTYRPLSGRSYVKLPAKFRSPRKGLINIKYKDQTFFLCCHLKHLNSVKIRQERITQTDKELVNNLDYDGIKFSVDKEDFSKIETKNNICINVCCYENKLVFPIHISDQKFENLMDLLLVSDENKSHYVYIKAFNRYMFHKTKHKNKQYFCKSCLQCFSNKNVLIEHEEVCLSIKIRKRNSRVKQIPVSFKIYANFECNLKSVKNYEGSYSKKHQDCILCSFVYKLVCVDDNFIKKIVVFKGENVAFTYCNKIVKITF